MSPVAKGLRFRCPRNRTSSPAFAGWLMQVVALGSPLVIGAAMKIGYDFALWAAFRKLKPPEES